MCNEIFIALWIIKRFVYADFMYKDANIILEIYYNKGLNLIFDVLCIKLIHNNLFCYHDNKAMNPLTKQNGYNTICTSLFLHTEFRQSDWNIRI